MFNQSAAKHKPAKTAKTACCDPTLCCCDPAECCASACCTPDCCAPSAKTPKA
jgi:hypothetical protein